VKILFSIFACMFGMIIGSFLNVLIYRMPRGLSIIKPNSFCPNCNKPITWYENIPLFSYIILGGRCKYCKALISFQYFLVELLTPITMVLLFLSFGISWSFIISFIFSASLIVITFIDFKHQLIPDVISLPGILFCFLCSFIVPWIGPLESLLGILFGGGILYVFALGYQLLTKKEGMGGGDIKLLAMIGAFLGWKGALVTLILGACVGSIIGLILIICKGKDLKYAIPFGPFLSTGAFCSLLFGEKLIRFYVSIGSH